MDRSERHATGAAGWCVHCCVLGPAVERAYLYFFNDDDKPGLHASAGITRHFQPKPSYHALTHLQRVLGEYRFRGMVTNDSGQLRVQEYRNDANKILWAVWSPTVEDRNFPPQLDHLPADFLDAQRMPLTAKPSVVPAVQRDQARTAQTASDESPLYLVFENP